MKNSDGTRNPRSLIIICVALLTLAALPLVSRAQPSTSVNIVNNSNRVIRNVYLSHVDVDDWGANQLSAAQRLHLASRLPLITLPATSNRLKSLAKIRMAAFFRRSSPVAIMPPGRSPMTQQATAGSKGTRSYPASGYLQ